MSDDDDDGDGVKRLQGGRCRLGRREALLLFHLVLGEASVRAPSDRGLRPVALCLPPLHLLSPLFSLAVSPSFSASRPLLLASSLGRKIVCIYREVVLRGRGGGGGGIGGAPSVVPGSPFGEHNRASFTFVVPWSLLVAAVVAPRNCSHTALQLFGVCSQ